MHTGTTCATLLTALLLLAGCVAPYDVEATGPGSTQPGWTGRTQVIGNTSTVASNAEATYIQQKWGVGRQR